MVSNSCKTTEIHRQDLGYQGKIQEYDSPRNDNFQQTKGVVPKINKYFGIEGRNLTICAPN